MVVSKKLPNAISTADVSDGVVRQKLMLLDGNVKSLHSQIAELQNAVNKGTGSGNSVSVSSLAEEVAPLVASTVIAKTTEATQAAATATTKASAAAGSAATATTKAGEAATSATSAATSATNAGASETNAATSATNAGTSETNAATSATNAATSEANALTYKSAAEAARDRAEAAAANMLFVTTLGFCNVDLGADTYTKFFMDGIVTDTTKTYDVKVTFNNTYTTTYACSVTAYDSDGEQTDTGNTSVTTRAGTGYKGSVSVVVDGDGFFKIDNVSSYVDVVIQVKEHVG